MREKLLLWEGIFVVSVCAVGSLLHFVYRWSGKKLFAGFVSPVNESTWEHLKLLFFPSLLFGAGKYLAVGKEIPPFSARQSGEHPCRDGHNCRLFLYLHRNPWDKLAGCRYPHLFSGGCMLLLLLSSFYPLSAFFQKSLPGRRYAACRGMRLFFRLYLLAAPHRIVPRPGRRRLSDTGEITGRPCFPRGAAEDSSTEKTAPWGGFLSGSREF